MSCFAKFNSDVSLTPKVCRLACQFHWDVLYGPSFFHWDVLYGPSFFQFQGSGVRTWELKEAGDIQYIPMELTS